MKNQTDELFIIEQIREGKANKEIAEALHISEGAVKNRVHQLFRKHNCRNRVDLAIKTLEVPRGAIER